MDVNIVDLGWPFTNQRRVRLPGFKLSSISTRLPGWNGADLAQARLVVLLTTPAKDKSSVMKEVYQVKTMVYRNS